MRYENIKEEKQSLKGQVEYIRSILNAGGLEQWEAKEYATVEENALLRIKDIEEQIAANSEIFADIFSRSGVRL